MDNIKICLQNLTKIVHSKGFITESEFFSKKKNRNKLYSNVSESFLAFNREGTPMYPIRDQFGNISISVLERSLLLANRNRNHIIAKEIKEEIDQLHKLKIGRKRNKTFNFRRDLGNL